MPHDLLRLVTDHRLLLLKRGKIQIAISCVASFIFVTLYYSLARSFHIHQSIKEDKRHDCLLSDFARALYVWGSNCQGCLGIGETGEQFVLGPTRCRDFSDETDTFGRGSHKYSVLSVAFGAYHCAAVIECCIKQVSFSVIYIFIAFILIYLVTKILKILEH